MSQMLVFFILLLAGITLGLVAVDRFARGLWRKSLILLMCLVLVGGVRLIFLEGDVAWQAYEKSLQVKRDITWRQKDILRNQIKSRQPSLAKDNRFFALGSSQVAAIFRPSGQVFFMSMVGLSCYEYPFFVRDILLKRPSLVILYLSEYDLAKNYNLKGLKSLPADTGYLFSLLGSYIAAGKKGWVWRFREACLTAYENLVPEVKYGFIPRGLWNICVGVPIAEVETEKKVVEKGNAPQDDVYLQSMITKKTRSFTRIPFDGKKWLILERFITVLEEKGINIVILEGQYYPAVMTSDLGVTANRAFRDGLLPIVERHSNVRFIPREEQFLFSAEDYQRNDWLHVEKDAARRYNEYLWPQLSRSFVGNLSGSAVAVDV